MPVQQPAMKRVRALVVDETRFMRALVADLLRQIGLSAVNTASSLDSAVAAIKHWSPDVVFTELDLGDKSGLALLQWIRTAHASPDASIAVIVMAAATRREQVIRARDAGATEFLAKPVTIARVEARLRAALESRRKFIRAASYVGPCRRRRRLDYAGPLRRIEDPAMIEAGDIDSGKFALLEADVVGLATLVRRIDVADRDQLSEIHARVTRALELADQAGDIPMREAAGGLIDYLDALGAGGEISRDTVLQHVSAMSRLASIDLTKTAERRAISADLQAGERAR